MTQDEIIEFVRQVGLHVATDVNWMPVIGLAYAKNLIELAAAKEREACAVLAEEHFCGCGRGNCLKEDVRAHEIARLIRAKGEI